MTKLDKIIRSRKSTYPKDYDNNSISKETLDGILSVTVYAPTHKKTYPWRFQVFTKDAKSAFGKELSRIYLEKTEGDKFSEAKLNAINNKVEQSGAVIAIIHDISHKVPEWEEVAAIAMAVQNMLLKATSLGIGAYWSTLSLTQYMSDFLDLGKNQKCLGLFYLGHTDLSSEIRDYDWQEQVLFK